MSDNSARDEEHAAFEAWARLPILNLNLERYPSKEGRISIPRYKDPTTEVAREAWFAGRTSAIPRVDAAAYARGLTEAADLLVTGGFGPPSHECVSALRDASNAIRARIPSAQSSSRPTIAEMNAPNYKRTIISSAPELVDALGPTEQSAPAAASVGTPQGRCETTLTERFAYPDCKCGTYPGNLGPCKTFEQGAEPGFCVYCMHKIECHDAIKTLRIWTCLGDHIWQTADPSSCCPQCNRCASAELWSTPPAHVNAELLAAKPWLLENVKAALNSDAKLVVAMCGVGIAHNVVRFILDAAATAIASVERQREAEIRETKRIREHAWIVLQHLKGKGAMTMFEASAKCLAEFVGTETPEGYLELVEQREAETTKPDDGWVEWKGGERPVAPETSVIVKVRAGWLTDKFNANQLDWRWQSEPLGNDIIAYRIVPQTKPVARDWRDVRPTMGMLYEAATSVEVRDNEFLSAAIERIARAEIKL